MAENAYIESDTPAAQPAKTLRKTAPFMMAAIAGLMMMTASLVACGDADSAADGNATGSDAAISAPEGEAAQSADPSAAAKAAGSWTVKSMQVPSGTLSVDQCRENNIPIAEGITINADGTYSLNWPGIVELSGEKWVATDLFADYPFAAELPALTAAYPNCKGAYFILDDNNEHQAFIAVKVSETELTMLTMKRNHENA